MYLNVNLSHPDPEDSEGSVCSATPKTPEILNSLISLSTASAASSSPAKLQCQLSPEELLSPTSSTRSNESRTSLSLSETSNDESCSLSNNTNTKFTDVSSSNEVNFASLPKELPSPINTVEATKSALIKEGLKHQITSKLQAAGLSANDILCEEKNVKEELSDYGELTPQDEERRLRRRERNKIAATKCRNKKKEKTVILISESETVEDQNIRLKNEIQRLQCEKQKLEDILEDPNHVTSCKHSCSRIISHRRVGELPNVADIIDSSHRIISTCTEDNGLYSIGRSDNHFRENCDQSFIYNASFCSPRSVSTNTSDPTSPSYVNLSSSSLSPLSLPSVSSPQMLMSFADTSPQCSSKALIASDVSPLTISPFDLNTFVPTTQREDLISTLPNNSAITSPIAHSNVQPVEESVSCQSKIGYEYSFALDVRECNNNEFKGDEFNYCHQNLSHLSSNMLGLDTSSSITKQRNNPEKARATLLASHCRYSPYEQSDNNPNNTCSTALPITKHISIENQMVTCSEIFSGTTCNPISVNPLLLDDPQSLFYPSY